MNTEQVEQRHGRDGQVPRERVLLGGGAGQLPDPRRLPLFKEYEIERLMREAPFLLISEGTSDIQKQIISRGLLRSYN